MKYYIDTEFLEGTQKETFPISLFRKNTPPTIDLISIGIVSEDGREYYEISKDFNLKEAWNRFDIAEQTPFEKLHHFSGRKVYWIRENVLKPIWRELFFQADDCSGLSNKQTEAFHKGVFAGEYDHYFTFKSLKFLINRYGKPNKEIADGIISFTTQAKWKDNPKGKYIFGTDLSNKVTRADLVWDKPEFYAYYADYDWVVFCWIFGKMMDLPKEFPMYCKDLKQILDEKEELLRNSEGEIELVSEIIPEHECAMAASFKSIKDFGNYPKQDPSKAHNAIEDARWNKQLYEFLNSL